MAALTELREHIEEVLAPAGQVGLAYVRPLGRTGRSGYGMFSAEGELLGVTDTRESAFGLLRQQGLDPVDVH